MSNPGHRPRSAEALDQDAMRLVDVLLTHIDATYATNGLSGARAAIREMLSQLDRDALTGLVHEFGLETEPVASDTGDEPRPAR